MFNKEEYFRQRHSHILPCATGANIHAIHGICSRVLNAGSLLNSAWGQKEENRTGLVGVIESELENLFQLTGKTFTGLINEEKYIE